MIKKQNPLGRILFIIGAVLWIQLGAVFLPAQSNEPIDRMQASTVLVVVKAGNQYGSGSGFVVGNGKYVVTNWHVIRVASGIVVLAGREKARAVVKRQSERKDLAILELETRISRPDVTFAPRSLLKKAQVVYAMGFPGAAMDVNVDADSSIAEVKISKGIISAFVKSRTGTALLQTDAAINPGNSGGPLFNTCGHVVGINDMKALTQVIAADGRVVRVPEGEGVGWAIQTDELFQELDNAGISYKRASAPCLPQTGSTTAAAGRDPLVLVGILAAILLGVIAVVLALTKQGRQVVKNVKNTFSKGISPAKPTPKPGPPPPPGKKLKPLLRGTAGQYQGMEIELDDDPLAIGRDPGMSQLVLTQGQGWEEVSGRHCTITYNFEKKCFFIEDHWSSNGTYLLSGKKVEPGTPVPLKSGERFYLSGKDVMFEVIMEE